jgi:putative ATPase
VADRPAAPVPPALRNAPTRLMKDLGYGKGYAYAHDVEGGVAGLDCLPDELGEGNYYRPTDRGFESELKERKERFASLRQEARRRRTDGES